MTNARLRYNGLCTGSAGSLADLTLSGSHTNSTTTLTFNAALTYANGTAVPTLAGGDYFMLEILDSGGRLAEIVKVTAYTTAGTTATVVRGQEGTSGVAHASGAKVVHGPAVLDLGGPTLLASTVLGSAAASVTFSSSDIPTSGYNHLRLEVVGRTAVAAANDAFKVEFNGDTTATNYWTKWNYYTTSTQDISQNNHNQCLFLAGNSATANRPGRSVLEIPNYRGTTFFKVCEGRFFNPGTPVNGLSGLLWNNTAAITSMVLTAVGGNFQTGSAFYLYGMP